MPIFLVSIGGIIFILIAVFITVYNQLIALKTKVQEARSDIDVQLKRRHDLVPNLVDIVKGAKNFESDTLQNVIKARQQAVSIEGLSTEKAAAEGALTQSLRQLFALSESYPDLKSNQNFLSLQEEIASIEDRILASRRFYNTVVTDYNTVQLQFPAVLFRGLVGAVEEPFFELENPQTERAVPKIEF